MPIAEVNGTKINYRQLSYKGEDTHVEELVMIHGLATNMAFWLQDIAGYFSRYFRVTVYDLRGHGRSTITKDGYTPSDMAVDLKALLNEIGIDKAHFVAHSFGGVVAMNLAVTNPEIFSSLVIADSHTDTGRKQGKITGDWKNRRGAIINNVLRKCNIELDINSPYFGHHFITEIAKLRRDNKEIPEILNPWIKQILNGNSKRTAENWLHLMEDTDANEELKTGDNLSDDKLKKIKCPTLLMYGEHSPAMPSGQYLSSLWSRAEFIPVYNSGHFFPREKPEVVIEACEQFWNVGNYQELLVG